MKKNLEGEFEKEYKKLNKRQLEAVDAIDGPVMVVAGPGTGKTQILALRIAHILKETDTKADSILALTFTNSAVAAMQDRLIEYIGAAGKKVKITTFHSFGLEIITKYFEVLGLKDVPKLLDDAERAILFGEILEGREWEYLRPRSDSARYFSDLQSLFSLLKRERISVKEFTKEVTKEIKSLGTSELKKDAKKIESLERSREATEFFTLYDEAKKEKNLLDYDDVLEKLVEIMESSKDAVADMRERYLYVLVDEHQDSSRVQNEFLEVVWQSVEQPNVFVVGDDRQLIYGFSGASIDHFQGFKKKFKSAKLITLVDNYRSTQVILDASHALLQSVMSDKKLVSQSKEKHPIRLLEAEFPDQEILACAQDIVEKKLDPSECALLVPKNADVRRALKILHSEGLPVAAGEALNLFEVEEAQAFLRVLKIINEPSDIPALTLSFFDEWSGMNAVDAHKYFAGQKMRDFTLETAAKNSWIEKLKNWKEEIKDKKLAEILKFLGEELLGGKEKNKIVSSKEILDTYLALAEKQSEMTLGEFVIYLDRLENYNKNIPIITEAKAGIKVLTLHSSKGLEFEYVWIAHMNERGLAGGKKMAFTLPENIREKLEDQDIDAIKRKLYVAITRAKKFCTLSYATNSHSDSEQELAKIIADLPEEVFEKQKIKSSGRKEQKNTYSPELIKLVAQKYKDRYVSVSLLNNFFECPRKWYFRNLLQLPEESSPVLEFGSKVHAAIEGIFKTGELEGDQEILKILSPWFEKRFPEILPSRQNELSLSITSKKFPHLNFYGRLDLVENLPDGSVRVTDFKTGSAKRKSEIEKLDDDGRLSNLMRQLAMYMLLIKKTGTARLEFLEAKEAKQAIYDHIVSKEEIDLLVKDIADYDRLVSSSEWVNMECNYNSYGKGGDCPYCQLAEVFKS